MELPDGIYLNENRDKKAERFTMRSGTLNISSRNNGWDYFYGITASARASKIAPEFNFLRGTVNIIDTGESDQSVSAGIDAQSSNKNVVSVVNGELIGVNAGTAIITAKTINGKIASCTVTVVVGVRLDANGGQVGVKELTLGAKYNALPNPFRGKYAFIGWYRSRTDGKKVTNNMKLANTKSHVLYASRIFCIY